MNASDHPTGIQIAAFGADTLPERESRTIGRHLTGCADCRRLLPPPDPKRFWTAVMVEGDPEHSQAAAGTAFSTDFYLRRLIAALGQPGVLAWSGGTLLVLLSLALLILFTFPKETGSESDVARSAGVENLMTDFNGGNDEPRITLPRVNEYENRLSHQPVPLTRREDSPSQSEPGSRRRPRTPANTRAMRRVRDGSVSSTRGSTPKCGLDRPFEMQLVSNETHIVLSWERVPNAAKYHLYISDDDEILIDEFETESGTSYTLNKILDPMKSYIWKIVITLENGQTLNVDAQKFSARDLPSDRKVRRSKARVETRCLAVQ